MNSVRIAIIVSFFVVVCGCAALAVRPQIAGYYASNPVTDASGNLNYTKWTLTLSPDGTYVAGRLRYLDGELARESVLEGYDLRANSRGSWSLANGQLLLRTTSARDKLTEQMMREHGHVVTPEESVARVVLREGHWVIDWKQVEYRYVALAPNRSSDPTLSSVTPPAVQEPRPR